MSSHPPFANRPHRSMPRDRAPEDRCRCGHKYVQHTKRVVEEVQPCLAKDCDCQRFRRGA